MFYVRKSWAHLPKGGLSPTHVVGSRTMATTTGKPKEFLCIIQDKPNALATRKKVRA